MDIPSDTLATFISITNADQSTASQLLRDSGLDLEAAISSFFAIQAAGGLPTNSSDPPLDPPPEEEHVPAPLPQVVDRLLPDAPPSSRRFAPPVPEPFADGTERGNALAELFRPPTHLIFSGNFDQALTAAERQRRWLLVNIQDRDAFACLALNRDVWSDNNLQQLLQASFVFWQRDSTSDDGEQYARFYPFQAVPHIALIDPRSRERVRVWNAENKTKEYIITELEDFLTRNSLDTDSAVPRSSRDVASSTRAMPQPSYNNPTPPPTSTSSDEHAPANPPSSSYPAGMSEEDQIAAAVAASMGHGDVNLDTLQEAQLNANGSSSTAVERQTSRLLSATDPALNKSRSLRAQQDSEYEQSLALDRAKEESKRDEALRRERMRQEEELRLEKLKMAKEAKKKLVPPVPLPNSKEELRELVIRLPDGKRLQRRFLAANSIGNVYDYVESEVEELHEGKFLLMQMYPKKSFKDREELLTGMPKKNALVVDIQ